MARIPTLSVEQCEAILGPRGSVKIDSANRATVKKWLTAQGFKALFTIGLSIIELSNAYNRTDGSGLEALRKKYENGIADGLADGADVADVDADENNADENNQPATSKQEQTDMTTQQKDAAQLLRDLIMAGYTPPTAGIDENAVKAIVQDALAGIAPRVLEIRQPDMEAVRIEGLVHPEFDRCLKYLMTGANVMLVGPAGCGKTTLGAQLAKAMNREFGVIGGTAGATESELNGWLLPVAGGAFEYAPSQFVTMFERGNALWMFDEIDAFDPNMLLVTNSATANGKFYVAKRRDNPEVLRGPNMSFLATANTFGTGANPLYTARSAMDEATRDRWLFVTMDYDKRLEESIAAKGGLTAAEMAGIWELRDKCREAQLRRVISTRAFEKAAIMKQCGDSWREIRDRLLEGWSKDEKAKVGA